ncbi:MAG: SDR family NAD(P)-dependent oxidoreductase [Microcystaceae cyanobacterium]
MRQDSFQFDRKALEAILEVRYFMVGIQRSTPPKTALITGASSGIGYEFAQLFANDRYNLVLVARSEETLKKIAAEFSEKFGISVKIIPLDLSIPGTPDQVFLEVRREGIELDVLVNNAGFATYGFFSETDVSAELKMMQVNMVALTHLTKLFLKDMIARHEGKILNVSSTAGFQPGPLMAVYYATKAYVLSFSEAIANELEGSGVTVTVLCPGPTETGFQSRAKMKESRLFRIRQPMDVKTVARLGYWGLMHDKAIVIPGFLNKVLALANRFIPREVATRIVRNMQAKEG